MGNLIKSASEIDDMLAELTLVARDRNKKIQKLNSEMYELERHKKQLQQRIHELDELPTRVADYFVQLTAKGERRSALREYLLFGADIVVSVLVAIVFKLIYPR